MKLYHGTSNEILGKIQEEGVLWGIRFVNPYDRAEHEWKPLDKIPKRFRKTYFATSLDLAWSHGQHGAGVVLEIDYEPITKK